MATYEIKVSYSSYEVIEVDADNLTDAVIKARDKFLNTPDERYLTDSFEVDEVVFDEDYPNEKMDWIKYCR